MKTAIQRQIVSPESEFIESIITGADVYEPWRPHTDTYDLAVCIGPVTSCPPAKRRILFVLGQTANHPDLDWDTVVVTSDKAYKLVLQKFGHGVRVVKMIPPVFNLEAGQRRLVEEKRGLLHASEVATYSSPSIKMMSLWGIGPNTFGDNGKWIHPVIKPDAWFIWKSKIVKNVIAAKGISLFNALEFNSAVRGGAIGFYPNWMDDGYDIQVRRHLALGGRVCCRADKDVLGDYAELVDGTMPGNTLSDLPPVTPVVWEGTLYDYAAGILGLINSKLTKNFWSGII